MNWIHISHYETWQGWKHQDCSKIQLPRGRADPKVENLALDTSVSKILRHTAKGIKQQTFLGDSWQKAALLMRGWCPHLQSSHSSRSVFLRQDISCHISWCRLQNEDAVMGQGFVPHATLGPGMEGRMSGHTLGTSPHHQGRGMTKRPEWDASCFTSDSCMFKTVTVCFFYTQKRGGTHLIKCRCPFAMHSALSTQLSLLTREGVQCDYVPC